MVKGYQNAVISNTDLKEAIFEILKSRLEETDNSEESKDDSS